MEQAPFRILVAALALALLFGCGKQTLPVPEYPLAAQTVAEAAEIWGAPAALAEDGTAGEGRPEQSLHTLWSTQDSRRFVAGVSSVRKDGERLLFIAFPPFFDLHPVPLEEAEGAFAFAARLFGGFEDEGQVYDCFVEEYGEKNTQRKQYPLSGLQQERMREGESVWEREIGGITCRVTLEQPRLNEPLEYIRVIQFATDRDAFFGEQPAAEEPGSQSPWGPP